MSMWIRSLQKRPRIFSSENTTGGEIEKPREIHQLGLKELTAIRNSSTSDRTKVLNLRKLIAIVALKDGPT